MRELQASVYRTFLKFNLFCVLSLYFLQFLAVKLSYQLLAQLVVAKGV